jgi:hypothetical protein
MNMKRQRTRKTAEELLHELASDPDYVLRQARVKEKRREATKEFNEAVRPLNRELARIGFPDIVKLPHRREYQAALPILLEWLPKVSNYRVKEWIVRALSVPWAKSAIAPVLVSEFRSAGEAPAHYKWAVGNALEVAAHPSVRDDLIELVQAREHGTARQMLVIALGTLGGTEVVDVLLTLLDDQDILGHVVIALGKAQDQRALPQLEPLLQNEKAWIRQAAKRSIAQIRKRSVLNAASAVRSLTRHIQ